MVSLILITWSVLWRHVRSRKGLALFLWEPSIEISNGLIGSLAYQVSSQSLTKAVLVAKVQGRVAPRVRRVHVGPVPKCKLDYSFAVVLTSDGQYRVAVAISTIYWNALEQNFVHIL